MIIKFTFRCALFLAGGMFLGQAHAMEYIPYKGFEGYQEIKISSDTYFVAFQGSKNTSRKLVKKAGKFALHNYAKRWGRYPLFS